MRNATRPSTFRFSMRRRPAVWALALTCALALIGTPSAQAQTYTVVHRFMGGPTDGSAPIIGLIGDSAGNAYGTTVGGGASGAGVVFQQDKTKETVLYSFTGGTDGAYPNGITRDSAGNLYGTTAAGGSGCQGDGCGVVFRLEP